MFLNNIETTLFKPLASANARIYGVALWALYNRLVRNQLDTGEASPKDCRSAIYFALLEHNQQIDWSEEDESTQKLIHEETDDSSGIYRYLRQCGWVREMDEVGYRRVTYMPRVAAGLISALEDISNAKPRNIGSTCQGIYLSLLQAKESPKEHATAIKFAADTARSICNDLNTIVASCREITHNIIEESATANILSAFFNQFIKGILLEDYTKLKTTNHPYRYRAEALKLIIDIQSSRQIMDALSISIRRQSENETAIDAAKDELNQDLNEVFLCFQRMDDLIQRIDHYRQVMTKRSREAMQYAMTAIPNLGKRIDALASSMRAHDDSTLFPAFISEDLQLGPSRLYAPRRKAEEAKSTSIQKLPPPIEQIASSRAMDHYYRRRSDNPQRIIGLIERFIGNKQVLTTDDLEIDSLDDFLAYIQLRDLVHDAVPMSSSYHPLLTHYKVVPVKGETTKNQYLHAPKLRIERRGIPPMNRKPNHAT